MPAERRPTSAPPRDDTRVGERPSASAPGREAPRPVDPQTIERAVAEAHRKLALEYATRFFRYEYQVGPSNVRVESVEFGDVTNRQIPGWTGTYEASGTAFLEYFDSSHLSYGRAKVHFEVRTEQKPNEDIKVVAFDKRA